MGDLVAAGQTLWGKALAEFFPAEVAASEAVLYAVSVFYWTRTRSAEYRMLQIPEAYRDIVRCFDGRVKQIPSMNPRHNRGILSWAVGLGLSVGVPCRECRSPE